MQWASFKAVIYKSGVMYDCLGMYWIFRHVIRSWDDIFSSIKLFAIFAIVSAPLIAAEKIRQASFYSIFGSVDAAFHMGRFRCAGPFPHYIMMGCFWASIIPLLYSMIKVGESKKFYWLGIAAAFICVFYSASSTPLMTVGATICFWLLYKYRSKGKEMFWGLCVMLLALHLVMKAPVWHLMCRINIFGGSTGWHRFKIFDEFIAHVGDWFFLGTQNPRNWDLNYPEMGDITNQYMLEGIRGGVLTMVLFVIILVKAVSILSRTSITLSTSRQSWLCWGICVSMLGHIVTFWGVSYFGQIEVLVYLTFSMVGFVEDQRLGFFASSFAGNQQSLVLPKTTQEVI